MKKLNIVNGPQNVSAVIQGCMRMPGLSPEDAAKVIRTAYDCGINFYDHENLFKPLGLPKRISHGDSSKEDQFDFFMNKNPGKYEWYCDPKGTVTAG